MGVEGIAYHEAGHAVMGWYFRKRFRAISIVPTRASSGRVCFLEPLAGLGQDTDEAVMVHLAGPMAAWPMVGRFRSGGAIDDLAKAERLVREVAGGGDDPRERLARLKESTWNVLARDELWRAVTALAQNLLRSHKLTGSEARRIIADAAACSRRTKRLTP